MNKAQKLLKLLENKDLPEEKIDSSEEIKSITDAINIITDKNNDFISDLYDSQNALKQIWFRGQQNYKNSPIPGIFRKTDDNKPIYKNEADMFLDFMLTSPKYREQYKTTFEKICLMQHYRIPTRLLDWSESILVALYFAVADFKEGATVNDSALFALSPIRLNKISGSFKPIYIPEDDAVIISSETLFYAGLENLMKGIESKYENGTDIIKKLNDHIKEKDAQYIKNMIRCPLAVFPYRSNSRMVFQLSMFTLHGGNIFNSKDDSIGGPFDLESFNKFALEKNGPIFLKKFKIPKLYKSNIKEELRRVGIHEGSLFPELEHQGSYITEKYNSKVWL